MKHSDTVQGQREQTRMGHWRSWWRMFGGRGIPHNGEECHSPSCPSFPLRASRCSVTGLMPASHFSSRPKGDPLSEMSMTFLWPVDSFKVKLHLNSSKNYQNEYWWSFAVSLKTMKSLLINLRDSSSLANSNKHDMSKPLKFSLSIGYTEF